MPDAPKQQKVDPTRANTEPRHLVGLPRQPNGPSAMDMLTSPVDAAQLQDDPELVEEFWYASTGLVGPGDPLDTDPDQEGPPGTARDDYGPGG